jgi:monoamine oxidase
MRVFEIGIVGGGPGGLMTAYSLQKAANTPIRITLFEASDRLGGKILTPHFRTAPVRYEAGAAEFYDYSQLEDDPLRELIAELGLPIHPMGGQAVILNNHILANLDDVRDQLGQPAHDALVRFDRSAKDRMTPREFYHSDYPEGSHREPESVRFDAVLAEVEQPEARAFLETLIHSDLATEPHQTSPAYGLQNYVMNDPAYMSLYGIEGGNERLPRALAERLAATIHTGRAVRSILKTDSGRLRVTSENEGTARDDEFDYVIVALPHNHLGSIEYPDAQLAEAMRVHHDRYDYPAHYLRITILFEEPFWRKAFTDSYWMLDQFGGCCLYDESSRTVDETRGVLGWLLGGEKAREMCAWTDEQLIAAALESLPEFLEEGRTMFIEGAVHRWSAAVNALPGGIKPGTHDQRHQPDPAEHANLLVVGDYMFDSTLNGVLDSAQYVAAWLTALIMESDS